MNPIITQYIKEANNAISTAETDKWSMIVARKDLIVIAPGLEVRENDVGYAVVISSTVLKALLTYIMDAE